MFVRQHTNFNAICLRVIVLATLVTLPQVLSAQDRFGNRGSNARSGPSAGGVVGAVESLSPSTIVVSTSTGQKVTVTEVPSTEYLKGTNPIAASVITVGDVVLVLGTVNGPSITASQIVVQATDKGGSANSTASGVVPFQRGAPSAAKQVGQIPNYTEGSGTIVSGIVANKATKAALASYPGGIVNRVVGLSDGSYEVHNIGVGWPHHIFVNSDFKVIGAF